MVNPAFGRKREEMDKGLVSVIVPVYNVVQYIEKCLRSIINQTYCHLEILVIDDGSTDDSGVICDRMAAEDSRIRVVHQENAGVSSARNKGLDICSGSFVLFVDSDDWIEPEMVELMVSAIEKTNTDLAVCQINDVYPQEDGSLLPVRRNIITDFDNLDVINRYEFYLRVYSHSAILCNKLYKRGVISEKRLQTDKTYGEDALFCLDILENATSAVIVTKPLYNYLREREGSVLSRSINHSSLEWLENSITLYKALSERGVPEAGVNRIRIAIEEVIIKIPVDKRAYNDYKEYLGKCHEIARKPSLSDCLKYYGNKEFGKRRKLHFAMYRVLPAEWFMFIRYTVKRNQLLYKK